MKPPLTNPFSDSPYYKNWGIRAAPFVRVQNKAWITIKPSKPIAVPTITHALTPERTAFAPTPCGVLPHTDAPSCQTEHFDLIFAHPALPRHERRGEWRGGSVPYSFWTGDSFPEIKALFRASERPSARNRSWKELIILKDISDTSDEVSLTPRSPTLLRWWVFPAAQSTITSGIFSSPHTESAIQQIPNWVKITDYIITCIYTYTHTTRLFGRGSKEGGMAEW